MKTKFPRHIGIIPDGNRRWAQTRGLPKGTGYAFGLEPGLRAYERCRELGIDELTVYGFTQDNVKRPAEQVSAFREACVAMAEALDSAGASVQAVGDAGSPAFPKPLQRFLTRTAGRGPKVNLLVNYGWRWDLDGIADGAHQTAHLPPIDLIIRWGGGRRLSGFLPIQSVYADFYVIDDLWPDARALQIDEALAWYATQDQTLGG